MNISEKANLIIYRVREKGLEIFLENHHDEEWGIPQGILSDNQEDSNDMIALDPVEEVGGRNEQAYAVEGDWHDIPSLKGLLIEDLRQLKGELKTGTFVAVKEALKRVLPHQYAFLKELKDIVTDRNSVGNI